MNNQKTVRLTVDLPPKDHKILKAFCAYLRVSMKDFVSDLIHKKIYSKNVPNPETLEAMKEAEEGIDVIECDDIDDFYDKLGI